MGEGEAAVTKVSPPAAVAAATRPSITVPPRAPFESYFSGGSVPGFSPGPMTLMSSFFSPDSNSCSFSQLLAGAMASPIARPGFVSTESKVQDTVSKEGDLEDGNEKGLGDYKQNRPMGLMVPNSPRFLFPPGLSPGGLLNSPGFLSPLQSPFGMSHQQALAHVTAQAAFSQSFNQIQADYQRTSAAPSVEAPGTQPSSKHVNTLQLKADNASIEPQSLEASQIDKKPPSFAGDKPDNDGYNWRKYGQKLVKAKEHPRSYYKCTYPECPVKKKVERAQDGHIDEITYKGQHNHDLPQPNVRAKDGRSQQGSKSGAVKPESRVQNQTTVETLHVPQASQLVKPELPTHLPAEQRAINIEADEMEDSAVVIDEDNDNDDEPNAKRRNVEAGGRVPAPSFKTVTEPKIVVHTRSEVDILIDGYKWRKYGQKVVKGNSHPRSYYRCTYPGCNVRKHVERSSADAKAVVTTYEGKHSHDTPIANGGGGSHNNTNGASKLQKPVPMKPSV